MQAIIVTGGKQYNVSEGDTLFIEKLDVEAARPLLPSTPFRPIVDGEKHSSTLPWWRREG